MKRTLLITFFITSSSFANEGSNLCKLSLKASKTFLTCERKKEGYFHSREKVSSFIISYKDETNREQQTVINQNLAPDDFISENKLKLILEKEGIKNITSPKILSVYINDRAPLYKDPEFNVLNSGCHMKSAPSIVSFPRKDFCDEVLCIGTIECKENGITEVMDSVCKAIQEKNGAFCPNAIDCLEDKSILVESY